MSNTGITEFFSDMGNSIGDAMRQEWKRRLLDDKVDYKRSILLSLKRQYLDIQNAVKDGFTIEMLQHAVNVLRKNGYVVDMQNSVIEKKVR